MKQKQAIIDKIARSKRGTIFMPDSFAPIDAHYAASILSLLCDEEKISRIAFGIYVKPTMSSLGPVMPSMQEIAQAIAKRDSAQILPSGATAENFLGFSTQIPMNTVYLTSGTPRKITIGKRTLTLKRSVPSTFAYKGKIMPILVLALKSIGRENITDETLSVVYGVIKDTPENETWQSDAKLAPRWIRNIIIDTKEKINKNEQMD